MSWTPEPQALEQLRHIFRGTLSSNNNERKLANEALDQAKLQPEIENYLLELLVVDDSAKSDIRAAAGINLKNSILNRRHQKAPPNRSYLLENILKGLMSKDNMVRNITGNVITSLFSIYGLEGWPQALPQLLELVNHTSTDGSMTSQEAASGALSKICEDSFYSLDVEFNGERPLNFMISNFLKLMNHPGSGKIRANSIHCIAQFIPLKTQSFLVHIDEYLQKLFELAHDPSREVRKNICSSFALILETRPDKLMPHLDGVINYCLHLMQDPSEEVALEACEFLLALSTAPETESDKEIFSPKLKMILPTLLDKMVYSEEDIFLMEIADSKDDATIADKDEDIKPLNAKSKDIHSVANTNSASNGSTKKKAAGDDSDSDFDDDEDEDDEDSELDQWSLRKCSAATLDILSLNLPGEVLNVTLPILQDRIVSQEWPVREAAILAFGAISKSCLELAREKLPTLVPFLVDRLKDSEPRVRQIACWTLSRFATWIAEEAHEGGQYANYFQPTFQSIVACSMDQKKVVQEAACSALSSFIEESDSTLIEYYLGPLLDHFAKCFQTYQRKNLIILYDCVQTFVEKMGYDNLASKPEYVNTLLPPLLHKWQILDDNDTGLWPLLECMASIAATLGELFAPYAVPVYERAINILSNCIQLDLQTHTDPSIEAPEKDFIVTSLDLVDGLIQGFGHHSADLIRQHNTNLMELLMLCFEDHSADVRQSAYALLGDLSIFTLDPIVKPYLQSIFLSIGNEINNRSYSTFPVYNNAIWALGEIAMRLPYEEMKHYLANLVNLLIPVLNGSDIQQTVLENAAICLGRMGLNGGAEVISPRLPEFIVQWCAQMLYLVDNSEKETGFQGMLNIIHGNPDQGFGGLSNQQGKKNLSLFVVCIGNYMEPPEHLKQLFGQFLVSYKQLLGGDIWDHQILAGIDGESRMMLSQVYGV
ncbi:putative importin, protein [Scheffersomyces stipitis CBS 6054]|uniref:Putative importin, protein n=1 Tax=Scheffersomyces stipitis (strain ATCC 58785 / CBS 6054 / NBRC 10063 / NRRL Y-11545) TaxID=322104 RepID=A3GGQ5_PICST|nr:putative importin, protein [Scheffersomyces stipitis CBS 6054]EAZ63965.2 putative importin, protein [Scheffersomyces stipitis CBS 6054]